MPQGKGGKAGEAGTEIILQSYFGFARISWKWVRCKVQIAMGFRPGLTGESRLCAILEEQMSG